MSTVTAAIPAINPRQRLSKNFSLGEFLRSETAERQEHLWQAQLAIPSDKLSNLAYLATTVLQPVRDTFKYPIRISSGYRSDELNAAVGGSKTSQHCLGQAADIQISDAFLKDRRFEALRLRIRERIRYYTGRTPTEDCNANYYLFAFICLRLRHLDIDQVIHEYGEGFGRPAWVHVSASPGEQHRKQILVYGRYWQKDLHTIDLAEAMRFGVREFYA
jgi:hypothetical protein